MCVDTSADQEPADKCDFTQLAPVDGGLLGGQCQHVCDQVINLCVVEDTV